MSMINAFAQSLAPTLQRSVDAGVVALDKAVGQASDAAGSDIEATIRQALIGQRPPGAYQRVVSVDSLTLTPAAKPGATTTEFTAAVTEQSDPFDLSPGQTIKDTVTGWFDSLKKAFSFSDAVVDNPTPGRGGFVDDQGGA